jgi:hypothetical protein
VFRANYGGTLSKSVTYYTQSYSGTIYGSTIYYYRYSGSFEYEINRKPLVTITNTNQTVSTQSGYNVITLKGKVHDPDQDAKVTLSATIAGITRTAEVNNPPATAPGSDNFQITWTLPTQNVPEGSYTNIAISATDARNAKNSANYTGTIKVDRTPPIVNTVSIKSNNANNTSLSKANDIVTLSFKASEALRINPIVKINGVNATVTKGSNNTYTATRTMNSSDADGVITFEISEIYDTANNKGTNVTSTNDGSKVTHDKTPPKITPISITSNGAMHPYVKDGDRVTVTFQVNETTLTTPTLKILGNTVSVSKSGSNYTGSYTIKSTDPEGIVPIQITATDLAGNSTTATSITTGTNVTVYRLPPKLETVKISTNNSSGLYAKVGDTVTLTYTFDKPPKSTPKTYLNGVLATTTKVNDKSFTATRTFTSSDIERQVTVLITDIYDLIGKKAEDGVGTTDGSRVFFDKTKPTLTTVSISSNSGVDGVVGVGNVITLNVVASEPLKNNPTINIKGKTATVTKVNDRTFRATYTLASSDSEGQVDFSISNIVDLAGNIGNNVTQTTDGSRLTNSYVGPKVVSSKIYSSNSTRTKAIEGDKVTVELTMDREVADGVKALIGGKAAYVTKVGTSTIKAERTMTGNEPEGIITFEIYDIADTNKNVVPKVTYTTDGSSVTYEVDKPKITDVVITSSNSNPQYAKVGDTITLTFKSNKNLRYNPIVVIANGFGTKNSSSSGTNYSYSYVVSEDDNDGPVAIRISNIYSQTGIVGDVVTTINRGSVIIDKTPPKITELSISGGNTVGSTVILNFTASESLKNTPVVTIGGISANVQSLGSNKYRATQTITQSMANTGTLSYHISGLEDLAGNLGAAVTNLTGGSNHNISDGSAIIITLSGVEDGRTYSGTVIPVYSATSTASSSVEVTATLDGRAHKSGNPVSSSGTHTLVIDAKDGAGNTKRLTVVFTIAN